MCGSINERNRLLEARVRKRIKRKKKRSYVGTWIEEKMRECENKKRENKREKRGKDRRRLARHTSFLRFTTVFCEKKQRSPNAY